MRPPIRPQGYRQICDELEKALCEITGFAAVSLQPNSGAQGEFAGLAVMRAYHQSRGEGARDVVLIPASAHGTNPASAIMAGFKVVVVATAPNGNVDVADLKKKAEEHAKDLAGLMITYPSTHGVFEDVDPRHLRHHSPVRRPGLHGRRQHERAGRAHQPGDDRRRRVPPEPAQDVRDSARRRRPRHGTDRRGEASRAVPAGPSARRRSAASKAIPPVSAAPWGSASILLISYGYIRMLGGEGVTNATRFAILNANYIKSRLEKHYDVLYTRENGRVAHEMIFDLRAFKAKGVEEGDVAKRLMDYGFHAPTVSFPVPGTLMIEPTESEPKAELDRFCDALIAIRAEIEDVVTGKADAKDNVLKNAPHTAAAVSRQRLDASVLARAGGLSAAVGARQQVLAERRPHRQSVRRSQPDLHLPADGSVRLI